LLLTLTSLNPADPDLESLTFALTVMKTILSFAGHNRLGLALQEMEGAVLSRFKTTVFGVSIGHTFSKEMLKKGVFVTYESLL
jgi:hypothetical protein